MKLLYLSPWFPFPPTNGSELRINTLLRGLSARHEMTLITFQRRPADEFSLREAREFLDEIHLVPWREFNPASRRARLGFLSRRPRSVLDTYSPEMAQCIRQAVNAKQYDVIVASQLGTAAYSSLFNGTPAVLDEIELGIYHQQVQGFAPPHVHLRHRLMWAKQSAYVRSLLPRFHACTVVSEQEKRLLAAVAPRYQAVELIPNCIDLPSYEQENVPQACHTLIFTGAFTYHVNYDAVVWFLAEIYPLIQQRIPSVQLVITGDHADLPLPPAENVTLTGYIHDVKPAIAGATVSLVPIRDGGGTRLKILEAMASRTAVVSTTKGAEGLDVQDGRHLLLADTPEAFAHSVIRLLQDPDLRQRLAKEAFRLVQAMYSWEIVMPRFLELVDRVAVSAWASAST